MKAKGAVFLSPIVCFLVCACTAQEIIPVELGQDVILPCKVPNKYKPFTAVEWIKAGLGHDYVFLYRDEQSHPENQHQSYQNRVDLQDKEMKDGNVSLILKNVMKNDTGIYECQVYRSGKIEPISNITLKVVEPGKKTENPSLLNKVEGNKTGVIGGSVVGVVFLLAVLVF